MSTGARAHGDSEQDYFTCPRCGRHEFGTANPLDPDDQHVVVCSNGLCGWSGSPAEAGMDAEHTRPRVVRAGTIFVRYLQHWAAQSARQGQWHPYGEIIEFSNEKYAYTVYADGRGGSGVNRAMFDQWEDEWDRNPQGPQYHVHWTEVQLPGCNQAVPEKTGKADE